MPFIENGHVYNVGFLANEMVQTKCIVNSHYAKRSFPLGIEETPFKPLIPTGKIGIVICYDVEFPELSRLMADEGMNILFVPFLTDTKTVTRVKHCAQARAIENECYVYCWLCVTYQR
jgi:predicted amidohydrolase